MWTKRTNASSIEEVILGNLGKERATDLNSWFVKSRKNGYAIKGLSEAVALINANKDKTIVICGDYDADGISATSILIIALRKLGFKVDYRIPKRHIEGYGLNVNMVNEIRAVYGSNVLLLTVDNGIVAFEPLALAKSYGWPVIVTDHHIGMPDGNGGIIMPEADIVIDPEALPDTADFDGYCGAGIAYKMALELIGNDAKILLPIAAIATVADVMPLHEENYVFVRDGITYINKGFMPVGLKRLIEANKLDKVTDTSIGFKLAPEFNAPGRLYPDGALKVIELLTDETIDVRKRAAELIDDNEARKTQVDEAKTSISSMFENVEKDAYVAYLPGINPGIVGIIAGHICEEKQRPVIVFTDSYTEDDVLVGSGRSVEGVDIKGILDTISSEVRNYGGHKGAAGIGLYKENLESFTAAFENAVTSLGCDFNTPEINYYDIEINVADLRQAIDEVMKFAPFGEGNPAPVFKVSHWVCTQSQRMPDGTRALYKEVAKGGIRMSSMFGNSIGFGLADKMHDINCAKPLNLYGKISLNYFNGTATPQVEMVDVEEA